MDNLCKDKYILINQKYNKESNKENIKENNNQDNSKQVSAFNSSINIKDQKENEKDKITMCFLNKKREKTDDNKENEKNINQKITVNNIQKMNEVMTSSKLFNSPLSYLKGNIENDQHIYNTTQLSEKFKIKGDIIGSDCLEGNKHYFVFINDDRKIRKSDEGVFSIKFEIMEYSGWLSFGLCDKKIVEQNKYKFVGKFSNNGYFFIATNNVVWHCLDMKQRKKIQCPKSIKQIGALHNIVECRYYSPRKIGIFG